MQIDDFKNLTLADKKRVLAQMQAQAAEQRHPTLVRDDRAADQPFPLTDLQGAYLAAKSNPVRLDRAGCHVYLEFDVAGLDPARLEQAWHAVAAAHPMIRAEVMTNGSQRIHRSRALPAFVCEDHTSEAAAEQGAQRVRQQLSHKLYRAGDWPLYEIRITRGPQANSRVHVSMDSWIVDAKSADLIYREWRAAYDQPGFRPEAPALEFRDFVHSMEAFKTSAGYARCLNYWQERLRDCPDGPALPYTAAMRQGPAQENNRQRLSWRLPAPAYAALQSALADRKLSSTAGVLTLFCEALRGWSEQARFGLILTMQNRPPIHADLARVVGPFTSTALFDADVAPGQSVAERAQSYSQQLLAAMNHGYVSAMAALRSLGPGRPVRSFPIVFTSLLGAAQPSQEPSWSHSVGYGVAQTPDTALHCQLRDIDGELEVTFDCVPSWFTDGFLEQLRNGFDALLRRAGSDPACWESASATLIAAPQLLSPALSAAAQRSVPMTTLQRGYLAERMRQPGSAAGYIARSFAFERLDVDAMQTALSGLLKDHPMLSAVAGQRGSFECADAVASYRIPVTPLGNEAPDLAAQHAQLLRECGAERQWPALRLHMMTRADGSGYLSTVLDMMAFDGHSSWLFYDELFRRYSGQGGRPESPLWKPWLVARGSHTDLPVQSQYWRQRFSALAAGPVLPAADGSGTERWSHTIQNSAALEQLADQHRVSVEALLLAAMASVLSFDRAPMAIGVVDYGLRYPESTYGFGDATRFAWAETAQPQHQNVLELARQLEAQLQHDRFHALADPFAGLRSVLAEGGKLHQRSVVMTNCLDAPEPHWPGVTVLDAASDTPGVDLDNLVHRSPQGIVLCWTVRSSCDLTRLSASFAAYCAALDQLTIHADALQAPVAMPLDKAAQGRIAQLAQWNATDRDYDRQACVHTLIERQAQAMPYAVALVGDDQVLTYQELDRRANRLANYLQQQGVRNGDLVAVMQSRSHELIATLLAILKCGAAFIPLNVEDPQQRLERVLGQAQARFVVSTRAHYGRFTDNHRRVLLIDADSAIIEQLSASFTPAQPVQAEDRAYIIFTSGSTGTPKGVVVRHRPVINLIEWAAREFGFNSSDRVLFVNPLSFDLAIFDLFGMLAYGASIRIVNDADRTNALAVAQYLRDEPITFWNSAPAYLQMVLPFLKANANGSAVLPRLRIVFLSGDWIPLAMPDATRALAPQAQIISLGGATEATVWSNFYPVGALDPAWRSIPYGRPIQNSRYYVLDEQLAPLPVGEAGDLYIGGECLSDGYINEQELTAHAFIPDPLHEKSGMLMYRTGDRARFFADGNIEFLGRIDQQVKLRGYRVELGEVEAALEGCGLVRAVAVVRNDAGGQRLVGFASASDKVAAGELRDEGMWQQLKARLPAYMVPSQIIVLPALPITPNGKVDRKRLGQDTFDSLTAGAVSAAEELMPAPAAASAPQDPRQLEEKLAQWLCAGVVEVFGAELGSVSLDDNLGYLGFNSLHYTLLAAKLANELQVALNPALFFRYTSVAEILEYLLREHAAQLTQALMPAAVEVIAPAPVSIAQEPKTAERAPVGAIAIIGMAGVMPQAADLQAFWTNLQDARDCSTVIPADRWDWRAVEGDPHGPGNYTNVHRAAFMDDVASFDASFFSIAPREAELMDPRQRMLLEAVWACLENGGQRPGALRGSQTGLFIGATGDEYATLSLQPGREIDRFTLSGVSRTILSNRISYLFDWHGPSEVVDTACSSSLVAVHNAVRALQNGDCSLAIAGGVNIMIDPVPHVCLNKIGMLAADGRCKTFDARADGYARGEGIGLVLLKPLEDAIRDGDPIHAVLRGTAVNHGGRASALSAPNPAAQVQVISNAIRAAGIDCGQLGYMEAHGTGTALGDPIEVEALKETFATLRQQAGLAPVTAGSVALSSVKPNVGHLEAAAGIAGMLKAVMCVKHGVLPATLHLEQLNPNIELEGSPFYIVRQTADWKRGKDASGTPVRRAAGISSFGFGGVNAHVIIEEYQPAAPAIAEDNTLWPVPLSAQTEAQLRDMALDLAAYIDRATPGSLRLCDVAYTLQTARDSMQERLLLAVSSLDQLSASLRTFVNGAPLPTNVWRGMAKTAPMRPAKAGSAHTAPPRAFIANDDIEIKALLNEAGQLWKQHGAAAWPWAVTAPQDARRIALPSYRFARIHYWLPAMSGSAAPVAQAAIVPSMTADGVIALAADAAVLRQHDIGGQGVLPAAAYLAILRQTALATANTTEWIGFGDIVWMQPYTATGGGRLKLEWNNTAQSRIRCILVSEQPGQRIEHCNAELLAPTSRPAGGAPLHSGEGMQQLPQDGCYRLFEQGGMRLGPLYRTVRHLAWNDSSAVAQLGCAAGADADARWMLTLDGALQAMALHQQLLRPGSPPSVPFNIRRLYLAADCPQQSVVHLQISATSSRLPKYEAQLLDTEGRAIGRIEACAGKTINIAAAQPIQPAHHYVPHWQVIPAGAAAAVSQVLMLSDSPLLPAALPAGWSLAQRQNGIQSSDESAWSALLTTAGAPPAVILLDYRNWSSNGDGAGGIAPSANGEPLYQAFDEAFALARVAMRSRLRQPLTVIAVTGPQSGPHSAAVQALGSFGRAVSSESPKIRFCAVELNGTTNDMADMAAMAAMVAQIQARAAGANRPVNYRYDARNSQLSAASLQPVAVPAAGRAALPEGSVVLVSGGAGGIGRLVASFLLARGCRVALLGRTAENEARQQMRAGGLPDHANCRYLQADVADATQVAQAVAQVRAEWGPIRAVFHAAGSRADGLLLRKDAAGKRAALEAKVSGALVLDHATRNEPLDYFVCFSSLAAYMGPVGQTDYAYANAFLNSFSQARNQQMREGRRSGLSYAVGWPLWRDGGMRMDDKEREYIRQLHGMEELATDAAMQCLFGILGGTHDNIALAVGDKDKIDRALLGNPADA